MFVWIVEAEISDQAGTSEMIAITDSLHLAKDIEFICKRRCYIRQVELNQFVGKLRPLEFYV